MNKQKILELTGLSEDQFYDQYPDQETFCSDYPDACNQLEEAQGGMQVGKVYDKYGNETFTPAPDPIHSDWQINDEGMNVRPRTVDRFGNPIGPTTQVLRIPVDRVPFNREPTMQRLNPAIQSLQHESANNVPTTSPIDILTPLIARYNLPKGMMQNSIPIEKLSAKQTMQSVGSTGAPYTAPVNKYKSIVDSLKASGQDSSFASRKKLAEEKGITGYTGTAAQNMALMNAINSNNSYQNGGVYTVKSGDNLSKIASLNNMSLQNLLKSNPNIENPNLIYPGDRINISNKTIQTKAPVRQVLNATNYPITATNSYGRSDAYNNIYRNVNIPVKQNITKNKIINTPKSLPNKKEQKPFIPDTPNITNIPSIPFNNENRHLESGMIEDKNKNLMYVIKDNQVVKTFPIMTGLSRNQNVNDKGLAWLEAHPKEARKYRATPTGTYFSKPNPNIYGHKGFNMQPIAAFGEPAPLARGLAQHVYFGNNPNPGQGGYDPVEGRRRLKIMAGPGEQRNASYGCTNMYGQDIDCLTGQLFPQGDTTIVVDTRLAKDKQFIQNFQHEQGGTAIFPSMRNFQNGGNLEKYQDRGEYRGQVPTSDVMQNRVPIGMQQIPTDPLTGQPLTREQISRFMPSFNTQQPVISQGTWKGNRTTKDNSFDPYSRIIEQDPQSEANVGKRMRKDFITKKVPAGVTAAAAIMAAPLAAPIVSAAMEAPLAGVAGLTGNNIINAGFATHGLKSVLSGDVAKPWQQAYKSGNGWDYANAAANTVMTGMELFPLVGPAYKGALEAGNYLKNVSGLQENMPIYRNILNESKSAIKDTYDKYKEIQNLKNNKTIEERVSKKLNDIPKNVNIKDSGDFIDYLHMLRNYHADMHPNFDKDRRWILDQKFNDLMGSTIGEGKFNEATSWNSNLNSDDYNHLYNQIVGGLNTKEISKSAKQELQILQNNLLYNSQENRGDASQFVKNLFQKNKIKPIDYSNDEENTAHFISELSKFNSLLHQEPDKLLTNPDAIEKLHNIGLNLSDDVFNNYIKNGITKKQISDAYEKFYPGQELTTKLKGSPLNLNQIVGDEKELSGNPYLDKYLSQNVNNNTTLASKLQRILHSNFNEPYHTEPLNNSNLQSLIGYIKTQHNIDNQGKLIGSSNTLKEIKNAIGTVNNAVKGDNLIGSTSLSTSSYPLALEAATKFGNKVKPKFSGNLLQLNTMGSLNDYPKLALKEINSKIEKLEKLHNIKFPKAVYKNGSYITPEIYFTKQKYGGSISPVMQNFKQGGYYGMDQKFHPNSDSGTYVTGAGYYFDTGGGTTASPASAPGTSGGVDVSGVPGAGAAGVTNGIRADGSFAVNDSKMPDGGYDGSGMMGDSAYEQSSPFDYNSSQFSEQSANKQQQYDPSQYTSEIDPSTGFTKYKKNGLAIRNIKREDPALWDNLTEQGHGARWATGQTDIQRVGRTAGAIGQGLEAGINVAGAIGGYLNNRNKQRNMDKSAINMGSTASMFTNPQGSGKGDYGVTGSTYGQFKPNQSGNMSFKGMYGKYGMQVPSYQAGGGFSNLFTSAQTAMPVISPIELGNNIPMAYDIPINDNTRVATPRVVENVNQSYAQNNNTSAKSIPNPKGKDIATRFNNPGNIIYNSTFAKMFGAVDSGVKQTDGTGHFASFPNLDAGLKARETQLFGTVDGIFKSKYYKPNTDIDTALKIWSNKGYGVNIYPEIAGKTLAEITPQERRELMKRQIKQESGSMYKYLKSNNYFKYGGQQQGGQVVDMDENQIQQFLAAGGQLEFLD